MKFFYIIMPVVFFASCNDHDSQQLNKIAHNKTEITKEKTNTKKAEVVEIQDIQKNTPNTKTNHTWAEAHTETSAS